MLHLIIKLEKYVRTFIWVMSVYYTYFSFNKCFMPLFRSLTPGNNGYDRLSLQIILEMPFNAFLCQTLCDLLLHAKLSWRVYGVRRKTDRRAQDCVTNMLDIRIHKYFTFNRLLSIWTPQPPWLVKNQYLHNCDIIVWSCLYTHVHNKAVSSIM